MHTPLDIQYHYTRYVPKISYKSNGTSSLMWYLCHIYIIVRSTPIYISGSSSLIHTNVCWLYVTEEQVCTHVLPVGH